MYAKGNQKRRVYEGGAVWKTDLQQRGGGIFTHTWMDLHGDAADVDIGAASCGARRVGAGHDRIVEQMKKAEGITEQLKATDQMEWVGRMNNIRQPA